MNKWLIDKKLFVAAGSATIVYFVLMIIREFVGVGCVQITSPGREIYLAVLTAYVGINEMDKQIKKKKSETHIEKKGEYFVFVWIGLLIIIWVLNCFYIGEGVVLQENLSTFFTVMTLFFGTEGLKRIGTVIKVVKDFQKELKKAD